MRDISGAAGSGSALRVLALTGGHRVDVEAFHAMVEAVCEPAGWTWAHAVQPGAQRWLQPALAGRWDAILLHDLPGLWLRRGEEPRVEGPSDEVAEAVLSLLDAGQGVVVLHHALSAWPGWEGWAEAIGGRFLYVPGQLRGEHWPDSGYRMARHRIEVVDPAHPVCAGIESFEVDDELYYAPVLLDRVQPLLRTQADLDGAGFLCAHDVVSHGQSTGKTCAGRPPTSDLVGWTTTAMRSPIAVLQPGDGPSTFAHPMYRRLVRNALQWVASPEAHAAAAAAPVPIAGPSANL